MKQALLTAFRGKFVRDTLVLQLGSVVRSGTYLVTSVLTATPAKVAGKAAAAPRLVR